MMAASGLWLAARRISWRVGFGLLLLLVLLPFAAYTFLPSFRNRVSYVRYEMSYFQDASYLPGSNDAVRIISMKAGWGVMMSHPLTGVGYGDIAAAASDWYAREYPGMNDRDRILPSNQWLMYGAGLGMPGLLIFCLCMALPFLVPVTERLPWYLVNTVAAAGFLFDIGLEVQFGVFIYCFTILWWFKWMGRTETQKM
jgi:hypothetical protein